jgi:hypothetical protein
VTNKKVDQPFRQVSPHQLFVYRFRNNDPVNPDLRPDIKMDTKEWAALFGFDLVSIS